MQSRSKALVIGNAGNWVEVLRPLKQEAETLYLDISKESLPEEGVVDYAFCLGSGKGTGEDVFSSFSQLIAGKFSIHQILNLVARSVDDLNLVVILSGTCPSSSSAALGPALLTVMSEHPLFKNKFKIIVTTTELSKVTTEERAYKSIATLSFLNELADLVILYDNDYRGYPSQKITTNPYAAQNIEITQYLEDLLANKRTTSTGSSLKSKIWSNCHFEEDLGKAPSWREPEDCGVTGKFPDFERDYPNLIPNGNQKFGFFALSHPTTQPVNAADLVEKCMTSFSAPVRLPLVGEAGIAFSLHRLPFFPDVDAVLREKLVENIISRPFVHNPEKHGQYGLLFNCLGVKWINFPILKKLLGMAVIYAEEKADEILPDVFENAVRKVSQEEIEERKSMEAKRFKKEVDRIFMSKAVQRKQESERLLLEELEAPLREKVKKILANRENESLSSIFERETHGPNPFHVILQEVGS